MNSPDYDDFIDMFSMPTPVSPLPPTPVASPSHDASEDPPVVSKSPDPPVKKVNSVIHRSPRSKERRNEERWNEERQKERRNENRWHEEQRPRDPRLYRRPNFRPPYQRHHFKPRMFQRPPFAQQLMPTSQENAQVFFHSQGLAVLCIRNSGFTLTNGVVSYAMDRQCPHELFKFFYTISMSVPFASPTNILNKPLRTSKPVGAPRAHSSEPL
ncbi:hypothetical protein TNCV_3044571 [Trichonephila clavipes]|nr:hypothetical protein TNCV_3044571 [Trichonephila clavipes]